MFVDHVDVEFIAGAGGNGIVSFRREKFIDRGGPNGGDGGDGGSIILKASTREHTLSRFRHEKTIRAERGENGMTRNKHGASADNMIVPIPVGTQVVLSETSEPIGDLTEEGQELIIAEGGKGGFGNAHFKSSTRQAPRVAEKGLPGEHKLVRLELKLIADVGLVGLPNAGKSTFLSVVSNAKPDIADYPFTTITPNLGVADVDGESLLIADIPGLIDGAHKGKGLGHEFLRHVERNKAILHSIDIYNEDVVDAYQTIRGELDAYSDVLASLPELVVLSKVEGLDDEMINDAKARLLEVVSKDSKVMAMSSQAHIGTKEVLHALHEIVAKTSKPVSAESAETIPVYGLNSTEEEAGWRVEKVDGKYLITGQRIEDFARKTYFDDFHSIQRLTDIMNKIGIIHELERLGYQEEETIVFGDPEIGRVQL